MSLLQVNVPEGFAQAVHLTQAELEGQIRLMAALKMFELGKLSSGEAAELAGVARVEFLDLCGRYQVPIVQYGEDELKRELEFLTKRNGNDGANSTRTRD